MRDFGLGPRFTSPQIRPSLTRIGRWSTLGWPTSASKEKDPTWFGSDWGTEVLTRNTRVLLSRSSCGRTRGTITHFLGDVVRDIENLRCVFFFLFLPRGFPRAGSTDLPFPCTCSRKTAQVRSPPSTVGNLSLPSPFSMSTSPCNAS